MATNLRPASLALALLLGCGGATSSTRPDHSPPPGPDGAPAPVPTPDRQADLQRAEAWVTERGGHAAKPTLVETGELTALFPSQTFFALTFPQWPVGVSPPEGLSSSNVLVVGPDAPVRALTRGEELDAFFAERFTGGAVDDATAERAARAYLQLVFVLVQDEYYAFEITESDGDAGLGTARALVTAGGNGELRVRLHLAGGFRAELDVALQRGPRPRCHATKLLDPDPIVRQIVRDDLLFMGPAALPYLRARRAEADPALAAAIDELIAEIDRR